MKHSTGNTSRVRERALLDGRFGPCGEPGPERRKPLMSEGIHNDPIPQETDPYSGLPIGLQQLLRLRGKPGNRDLGHATTQRKDT